MQCRGTEQLQSHLIFNVSWQRAQLVLAFVKTAESYQHIPKGSPSDCGGPATKKGLDPFLHLFLVHLFLARRCV